MQRYDKKSENFNAKAEKLWLLTYFYNLTALMWRKMRNFASSKRRHQIHFIKPSFNLTATEYIQLKAFARVDGLWVAVLWISTFLFYVLGLTRPTYGIVAMLLLLTTPLLLTQRLKHYRNDVLDGLLSFGRGWGYVTMMSFYGSLLFGIAVFAYFNYMDHGYLFSTLMQTLQSPEMAAVIEQTDMAASLKLSLEQLQQMRPIDLALNMMMSSVMACMLLGLPIAAIMQRQVKREG